MRRSLLTITLFLALAATGCTRERYVTSDEAFSPAPEVVALPLTAGVYYDPAFLDQVAVDEYYVANKDYRIFVRIGEPSVTLLNRSFASLFERVVLLDAPPAPGSVPPGLDVAIVPRIERAVYQRGLTKLQDDPDDTPQNLAVRLSEAQYGLQLVSAEGVPLADWSVYGRAQGFDGLTGRIVVSGTLKLAMERAAGRLVTGFAAQPEVRAWLQEQGIERPETAWKPPQ